MVMDVIYFNHTDDSEFTPPAGILFSGFDIILFNTECY